MRLQRPTFAVNQCMWPLYRSSLFVQDSDDGRKVQSEVKKYEQLLKTKLGNDKFVTVGVQTRDNAAVLRKLKEAQTNNAQHKDAFTQWETTLEREVVESSTADMQRNPTGVSVIHEATSKVPTRVHGMHSGCIETTLKGLSMHYCHCDSGFLLQIPLGATEDAISATMSSRQFNTGVGESQRNKMNSVIADPAGSAMIAAVHASVGTSSELVQVVDQVSSSFVFHK